MAVIQYEGRANQTKLHQDLCLAPINWANSRATRKGMRFATEFHVYADYIVDTAVILSFQWRFAEHYDVLYREAPGLVYHPDSVCYFEAKQSVADFKNSFGKGKYKGLNPKGTLNWVVTPKGLVTPEMVPGDWGLLEVAGNGLREIKKPKARKLEESELNRVGYEMLWKNGRTSQFEDRREIERRAE